MGWAASGSMPIYSYRRTLVVEKSRPGLLGDFVRTPPPRPDAGKHRLEEVKPQGRKLRGARDQTVPDPVGYCGTSAHRQCNKAAPALTGVARLWMTPTAPARKHTPVGNSIISPRRNSSVTTAQEMDQTLAPNGPRHIRRAEPSANGRWKIPGQVMRCPTIRAAIQASLGPISCTIMRMSAIRAFFRPFTRCDSPSKTMVLPIAIQGHTTF